MGKSFSLTGAPLMRLNVTPHFVLVGPIDLLTSLTASACSSRRRFLVVLNRLQVCLHVAVDVLESIAAAIGAAKYTLRYFRSKAGCVTYPLRSALQNVCKVPAPPTCGWCRLQDCPSHIHGNTSCTPQESVFLKRLPVRYTIPE